MQAEDALSSEDVDLALDDVLSRGEFRESDSMLDEVFAWLGERLDFDWGGLGWLGDLFFWFVIGVVTALASVALLFFLRSLPRAAGERAEQGRRGTTLEERVRALRREGQSARESGDLELALRKYLFALVLGLGGRGDLEYRPAWTNRELVRNGRPSPEVEPLLSDLVRDLEPKEFGREEASDGDVERLREICELYLGPLEEVPT